MKSSKLSLGLAALLAGFSATCGGRASAQESGFSADAKAILSKLESMAQGYHSADEWNAILADVNRMEAQARQAKAWDSLVEMNVIEAMAYSDMLKDYPRALGVLEPIRKEFGGMDLPAIRRLYMKEADVYAKLGDEAAISALIRQFKASPAFHPESYPYSVGEGRDTPLLIVRPSAKGSDSLTVTSMEAARVQARHGRGEEFPAFELKDTHGATVKLSDYRGKVVLVDFWAPGWAAWKSDVANLVQTYKSYKKSGFEIVGVVLGRPDGLDDFLSAHDMNWPQIVGDATLTKKLGIYGEATNFLLDRNGIVVARNVHGADLVDAVKAALGAQ